MKMYVAAVAFLAAGFLCGRVSLPSTHTTVLPDPKGAAEWDSHERAESELLTPKIRTPVADAVTSREPASLEAPPTFAPPAMHEAFSILEEALLGSPQSEGDEDAQFIEKYRGVTLDQLRVAELALQTHHKAQRDIISSDRMERGLFDTQYVALGEPVQPMTLAEGGSGIASFGFRIEPGDGFQTIKTTAIDHSEYPEFGRMERELRWVKTHVRLMEKQGQ
jgi:hypothetical protein